MAHVGGSQRFGRRRAPPRCSGTAWAPWPAPPGEIPWQVSLPPRAQICTPPPRPLPEQQQPAGPGFCRCAAASPRFRWGRVAAGPLRAATRPSVPGCKLAGRRKATPCAARGSTPKWAQSESGWASRRDCGRFALQSRCPARPPAAGPAPPGAQALAGSARLSRSLRAPRPGAQCATPCTAAARPPPAAAALPFEPR